MTAACPSCSPTSSHSSPTCLPACHRHLREGKALQTKLHLRSGPGVWLLLGVIVVVVGLAVAVAGYVSAAPKPVGGRGSTHVERMKLAGPVVMGVGLFIFICAATLLYENRDREVLRQEIPDDLEDLKGGNGWEDLQEPHSFSCQEQWESGDGEQGCWATPAHSRPLLDQNCGPTLPPPPFGRNRHVGSRPSPPPPSDAKGRDKEDYREEEEKEGKLTLLARVLHHQEPTPHPPSPARPSPTPPSCQTPATPVRSTSTYGQALLCRLNTEPPTNPTLIKNA